MYIECTLVMLVFVLHAQTQECDEGWHNYLDNGKCYHITSTPRTWLSSLVVCKQHGGTLATIADQDEHQQIAALLRQHSYSDVWLSGIHIWSASNASWTSGEPIILERWRHTECLASQKLAIDGDICVEMLASHEPPVWNAWQHCQALRPALCQKTKRSFNHATRSQLKLRPGLRYGNMTALKKVWSDTFHISSESIDELARSKGSNRLIIYPEINVSLYDTSILAVQDYCITKQAPCEDYRSHGQTEPNFIEDGQFCGFGNCTTVTYVICQKCKSS